MNYRAICLDDSYAWSFVTLIKAEALRSSALGREAWRRVEGHDPVFMPKHFPLRSRPDRRQKKALGALVVFDRIGFDLGSLYRTLYGAYPNGDTQELIEDLVIHNNPLLQELKAANAVFQLDETPRLPVADGLPWFPPDSIFPSTKALQQCVPTIREHQDFFTDILLKRSVFRRARECEAFFDMLSGVAFHDDLPFLSGKLAYDRVWLVLQPTARAMRSAAKRGIPVFSDTPLGSRSHRGGMESLEHIYQLVKLQLESSLSFPEPRSITEALDLREHPAVVNLREGLHRWTESLLAGSAAKEAIARADLKLISGSLTTLRSVNRGAKLLTYISIPATIADFLVSGGLVGLAATLAGVATQAVSDFKQRQIRQQIFGIRS